jgi:hypothetical protein
MSYDADVARRPNGSSGRPPAEPVLVPMNIEIRWGSAGVRCFRFLDARDSCYARSGDAQSLHCDGFDCGGYRPRGFLHLRAFGLNPGNRSLRCFSSRNDAAKSVNSWLGQTYSHGPRATSSS